MSHRYEELYKKIFESVIEILTQNYIYELPVKSITTDTELGLINAIKSVFIGINRIGCWYHLKANLDSFAKSIYLMNKKNKKINVKITREIIIRLARIFLDYNGDMKYYDNEINNMIAQYSIEYRPLIKYFNENKRIYFEEGNYNYNIIPYDIRTNSFLERYNKEIKKYMNNKKSCNWFVFMTMINEELIRINEILVKNQNKNVK